MEFVRDFEWSYRVTVAAYGLAEAAVFAMLPIVSPFSRSAQTLCLVTATFLVGVAGISLWGLRYKGHRPSETPDDRMWQPHPRVVKQWPTIRIGLPLAFPVMTIFTYTSLVALETGAVRRVEVFVPVAILYERVGFWPAVLSVPALGLLLFPIVLIKVRRGKSVQEAWPGCHEDDL